MDSENWLEQVIGNKLEQFGLPQFGVLKTNIQEHLKKIETAIQAYKESNSKALKVLRECKIDVLSISEKAEIARQTIYNNKEILETYIIKSQKINESADLFFKLKDLQKKNKELEEDIHLLQLRDVTIEMLKKTNEELSNELFEKAKEIALLENQNRELSIKIDNMEKKLRNGKHKVINIRDVNV